jgi:diaminohydroxyphosphoribosylaminopyrimidine deaminase/5-amino-6-(5-phosphoribosylamino)uracil reductase
MQERSPVRVVLDGDLRLPLTSRLVRSARQTPLWIVASTSAPAEREATLREAGTEVVRVERGARGLDLDATLRALAGRGITRLLVEGGPITAAAFVDADRVDEAVLVHSPMVIGADGIDALRGLSLDALTKSGVLVRSGQVVIGADTMDYFRRRDGAARA